MGIKDWFQDRGATSEFVNNAENIWPVMQYIAGTLKGGTTNHYAVEFAQHVVDAVNGLCEVDYRIGHILFTYKDKVVIFHMYDGRCLYTVGNKIYGL